MIPKFLIPILLIIVAVILRLQQKKKKKVGSLRNSRFFPNADKLLKKNANYHFFFFLSNIVENNYSGAKRGNKKIQGYACATSADHTACNLHPSPSPDLAALYVHSNHPGLCLGYLSC